MFDINRFNQTIEKVEADLKLLQKLAKHFEAILKNPPNDEDKEEAEYFLDEFANKILNQMAGPLLGHGLELRQYEKHKNKQDGRTVRFGHNKYADLVVTYPNGRSSAGKAIQLKSTITEGNSSFARHLLIALNQLTGERGETPGQNHRKIATIQAAGDASTWPFPTTTAIPQKSLNDYKKEAIKAIENCASALKYKNHKENGKGQGLNPETRLNLTNTHGKTITTKHKRTETFLPDDTPVRDITIKIQYDPPLMLRNGTINKISFSITRDHRLPKKIAIKVEHIKTS